MSGGRFPGSVKLASNKAGDRYCHFSGVISPKPHATPFTPSTVIWLASCTKLLTVVAVLHCVERGLFTLDDNVSNFLPELEDPVILHGFNDGGEPILSRSKRKMTIGHLVTHTSGMGYESQSEKLARYTSLKGEAKKGLTGNVAHGFNLPLLFEPGEGWHYGCGIDWAGKIVERANPEHLKLGMYMRKYIFNPLGMKSMTFSVLTPKDIRSEIPVLALRMNETNEFSLSPAMWPDGPPDDCGGVGLYASAEDYMTFLEMLLQNKGDILRPETVKEMFTPQLNHPEYLNQFMKDMDITGAVGVPTHVPCQWALGGLISLDSIEGRRNAGTVCWAGIPNVKWWIDFEEGICGLYASQVLPSSDSVSSRLYIEFEHEAYAKLQKPRTGF